MPNHDDHHHHDHDHSELSETQLRVRALETILTEKGYIDPAALDLLIETYETKVGPRNGARVVAQAWADPAFRARLLKDATSAIAEFGYAGRQGEHIVAVENTPRLHNMVVCTLCSCYPWPVLGLPPVWYKSAPYRSKAVKDPRGVLRDFGFELPAGTDIRVWDSTAEIRYLVVPMRPAGTEGWSEQRLAELVTRDSMIGTGLPKAAARGRLMDGAHDMGGVAWSGPVRPEPNEPVFHAPWERRAFAITLAMAMPGGWNIDMSRFARENRSPEDYLSKSYYQIWLAGLERLMLERGLIAEDEIEAGRPLHPAKPVAKTLTPDGVASMLHRGGPTEREATSPARFAVGDRVRAKMIHPPTHTRLPRYVRGHVGTVEMLHGVHVFPDSNAMGNENPQWLYTVSFDGRELWGADGDASVKTSVDAWEPYLEPA